MKRGFTFIEILIVVAILTILAAIMLPNLLEAQTRANVSRVKADMRTIAAGLAAYSIDHGDLPIDVDARDGTQHILWQLPISLTTPIAYLADVDHGVADPFSMENPNGISETAIQRARRYRYVSYGHGAKHGAEFYSQFAPKQLAEAFQTSYQVGQTVYGPWRLSSTGPDHRVNGTWLTNLLIYDPTNGTVSSGDIVYPRRR